MTRRRDTAPGSNSARFSDRIGRWTFSHDPINSRSRRQIFNRIDDICCECLLTCYVSPDTCFPGSSLYIAARTSPRDQFGISAPGDSDLPPCTIMRHHFSSSSRDRVAIIKIPACRIFPAYRRCNYRAHRSGRFARLGSVTRPPRRPGLTSRL